MRWKHWYAMAPALGLVLLGWSAALHAQTPASGKEEQVKAAPPAPGTQEEVKTTTPSTPQISREEQLKKWGLSEDPGPDPDPKKKWNRFGNEYVIEKYRRKHAAYDTGIEGWVRPRADINIPAQIYQQNDEYVWVFLPVFPPPEPRKEQPSSDVEEPSYVKYTPEELEFVKQVKPEFEILTPPPSGKVLTFVESSEGLPTAGSWRNGLDLADMNEDGFIDIVAPPQRGGVGSGYPYIYLGDGKGHWKFWPVKWPALTNYGTVAVGDINRDGHQDVVIGAHLTGVRAFFGDGKGNFTDASVGLPTRTFPTRRVILTDLNADGYLDIAAISEGALPQEEKQITGSLLRGFLYERRTGEWTEKEIADPKRSVGGDWLAAGNLNGDRYPDLVGSSIFFNSADPIYLSSGRGEWKPFGRGWLPFYSYYWAMTIGKFGSNKTDDLIMSYGRTWPAGADPKLIAPPAVTRILGLDRITFEGKAPKRTPIVRWQSRRVVTGLASADFDGDGKLDLIYWRPDPYQYVILLGDGKGGFRTATVQGLQAPERTTYDLKVRDVNGDGRPDVIAMYEASGNDKNGSIQVYLNRGVTGGSAAK